LNAPGRDVGASEFRPAAWVTAAENLRLALYASVPDDLREGDEVFDFLSRGETIGLNGISY
jgi:hypothetical protein